MFSFIGLFGAIGIPIIGMIDSRFFNNSLSWQFDFALIIIGGVSGVFAIMLGATSYFSKDRDGYGLTAFIIGLVSLPINLIWIFIAALSSVN